jgi:hypothetical protein
VLHSRGDGRLDGSLRVLLAGRSLRSPEFDSCLTERFVYQPPAVANLGPVVPTGGNGPQEPPRGLPREWKPGTSGGGCSTRRPARRRGAGAAPPDRLAR